jgi:hypothetical protein
LLCQLSLKITFRKNLEHIEFEECLLPLGPVSSKRTLLTEYCWDVELKDKEMDRAYGTYGREGKC